MTGTESFRLRAYNQAHKEREADSERIYERRSHGLSHSIFKETSIK